ncbi:MAG: LamG-like jellyroll fold domain-containing protein [Cyanobacteria bacterium J06592_8]
MKFLYSNLPLSKSLSALVGLSFLALPLPSFAATLVADYQFDNSLASSIEGAPSLFDLGTDNFFGTETVDGQSTTVFNFAEQTGLQLSTEGLIPNDDYSVSMLFNFDTVEFWRKILDVNNRVTDAGLYTFSSDMFYYGKKDVVDSGTGTPLGLDQWVQVVFTRDSDDQVVTYVDGVEQLNFFDDNNYSKIVPDDVLHFFRDDFTTGDSENSSGAIARLRVYDGALSASQVAALDRLPETLTAPPSEPEATLLRLIFLETPTIR